MKNHFKTDEKLVSWIILLSCFSYPTTATIIGLLNVPSTPVNIALKILYSIFYVFLIIKIIFFWKPNLTYIGLALIVFFIIYSCRLIYDISILKVQFKSADSSYVYSYFFGATLIPSIVILISRKLLNQILLLKYIFYAILLANVSILFFTIIRSEGDLIKMLNYRVEIESEFSQEGGNLLNPIIISFFGGLLTLISLNFMIFKENYNKLLLFLSFIFGVANLIFGASRGPLFSVIFLLGLSFFFKNFYSHFNLINFLKSILIFGFIILITYFSLTLFSEFDDISIVKRIKIGSELQEFGEQEYRNFAYKYAFEDFLNKPIFGNQFVGSFDNSYPHNVFIEVLMSTGISGGIFYFIAFFGFLYKIFQVIKKRNIKLFILFQICLMAIALALTSGSIFVNPESWVLLSLGLTINID